MIIYLVAPFRCYFNIDNSKIFGNEKQYFQEWKGIKETITKQISDFDYLKTIRFKHTEINFSVMKYQNVNEDGATIPPEVINLIPSKKFYNYVASVEKEICLQLDIVNKPKIIFESILFRIYDNTIGICEVGLEFLEEDMIHDVKNSIELIQNYGNLLVSKVVKYYYCTTISKLLYRIWEIARKTKFIESYGQYSGFPDMHLDNVSNNLDNKKDVLLEGMGGEIMWVNRSIFTNTLDSENRKKILDIWIPLTKDQKHLHTELLNRESFFLGWGHNSFDLEKSSPLSIAGWKSLLLCQYYYTLFESINFNLTKYIGISLTKLPRKKLSSISTNLQNIMSTVQIILTQYNDMRQNLQGVRKHLFFDLSDKWAIYTIVDNIEHKSKIVYKFLDQLSTKAIKRSQKMAELILFFIGSVTLVDIIINTMAFSRSDMKETIHSPANDGIPGILDIFLYYPPDLLMSIGIFLVAILTIVFLILVRDKN